MPSGRRLIISDEYLKHRYEDGLNCREIAVEVGCSMAAIRKHLINQGVQMRKVGFAVMPEEQKQLRRDWASAHPNHKPNLGKHHTEETKMRMSAAHIAENSPTWKGGVTKIIRALRHTKEYYRWRQLVIVRANGFCEHCGQAKTLQAHHKVSVHKDISLALDMNNGAALCKQCHDLADGRRMT